MLNEFWKQLKSGSDIRGIATNDIKNEIVNLTNEVIEKIAYAFSYWSMEQTNKNHKQIKIAVGHDSRISNERIKSILLDIFTKVGFTIYDCSLASTPAMFMTTIDLDCDAAIEITASHHPFNRNGLKFFTKDGGLNECDIEKILQYSQDNIAPNIYNDGSIQTIEYMDIYSNKLKEIIKKGINSNDYDFPLKNFKIVVDAGNGAGGFYATKVLEPLGADISNSQFLDPNGMFPNHIPNPENENAMDFVIKAVKNSNADLGIIFDTDVDRAGAVDSNGKEINRNRLIALASLIAFENNEGATIVTDSITSIGLTHFIENKLHAKHHRFKRGYKNVINEAIKLNKENINCPLAIETSGHAALRENYFLDDGAYLITKIIIKMVLLKKEGKSFQDVLSSLEEPLETLEIRMPINNSNFKDYGNKVIGDLNNYALTQKGWLIEKNNYEGIRINMDKEHGNGWFLLRLSIHDPIMPLNIESNSPNGAKLILKQILPFLKNYNDIDKTRILK